MAETLLSDRLVDLILHEILDVTSLTTLPAFADHSRETFDAWLRACRRVARETLFPSYREIDASPPTLDEREGELVVRAHPTMKRLLRALGELGVVAATRPSSVGGAGLPLAVGTFANAYLMAANLSAYGYVGLSTGAAHLIEAFGDDSLRARFMAPLYEGRFTGTMALTEPSAGSSLSDLETRATPTSAGHYLLRGAKIFISGGDHDLSENIVHLVLARIDGAPPGTRGISLFAVPKLREDGARWVPNDVHVTGLIHKIGWRGLPSVALSLGDTGDCRGWLVGAPHAGLRAMFQMMNEARLMIGLNGASTASVAYLESLRYADERTQGRPLGVQDPAHPPIALFGHPDVRRMLLRQKAIVEGSLCLLGITARWADEAEHATSPEARERARLLLDLITPIAKSVPAELGFQANTLALQIHGGYGYSSEYLPEAWLRDQKLNSIHEGTTQIQALDLVGRKVVAGGGRALALFREEVLRAADEADRVGIERASTQRLRDGIERLVALTMSLAMRGQSGDLDFMLGHATDYLELASIVALGFAWTRLRVAGRERDAFGRGLERAACYWMETELTRVPHLAALIESGETSFLGLARDEL